MHCHYCKCALYTMQWNPISKMAVKTPHDDINRDSEGHAVCVTCESLLIHAGSVIECNACDKPLYRVRRDFFQERRLEYSNLEGIEGQHDPIEGVTNRCTHCNAEIEWG